MEFTRFKQNLSIWICFKTIWFRTGDVAASDSLVPVRLDQALGPLDLKVIWWPRFANTISVKWLNLDARIQIWRSEREGRESLTGTRVLGRRQWGAGQMMDNGEASAISGDGGVDDGMRRTSGITWASLVADDPQV
jgi:hypothetical protein